MKTIRKESLGFTEGMMIGFTKCAGKSESDFKEVDWDRVMSFIEENKEKIESVYVGLAEDWNCTSGEVWNDENGYINEEDTYVFGSSMWATPSMEVDFKDGANETYECWKQGSNSGGYFDFSKLEVK